MTFEWLVAVRYLRSPNRPAVLRLVTLLAVIGVAAGVTTLVIALSMNTGFRQAIRDRLLSVTAHVNLKPIGPEGIHDYRELMARLSGTPGVRSIEPAIYNTVLLSFGGRAHGIVLKGVDPDLERRASEALRHIIAGSGNFADDADHIPALLVGRILADDLRISAGDYVTVTSPQGNLTPFGMLPRSRRFRVAGIFDSGFYDYDANWGFDTLAS
jgi:lipoprotein-releasing system permease protein